MRDGAILVEGAVVAEAVEIKLERFRLDQKARGHIVDHQMREIGLAGDRAERGEFRRGETRDIIRVRRADLARGRAPPCRARREPGSARPSCNRFLAIGIFRMV